MRLIFGGKSNDKGENARFTEDETGRRVVKNVE